MPRTPRTPGSPRKVSPDAYAASVASALTRTGLSVGRAVTIVQKAERAVRTGYAAGAAPASIARGLLPSRRRTSASGGSATFEHAANGCASVPVEAFMAGLDPLDLPPLTHCNVPGRGAAAASSLAAKVDVPVGKQQEAFDAVFGWGKVSREWFEQIYSGKNSAGDECRSKLVRVKSDSFKQDPKRTGATAILQVRLKMKIGSTGFSGEIGRTFYRYADRGVLVHHDIFDLTSDTPRSLGSGVGESITRSAIRAYRKLDLMGITTHAAWVGRYVWPSRDKLLDHFFDYIDERVESSVYELRGSSLLGEFSSRSFREFKMYVQGLTTRAWNFASLHLYNRRDGSMEHVGKKYLAGVPLEDDPSDYVKGEEGAPEWEGALILKEGHPTFERARTRLKL